MLGISSTGKLDENQRSRQLLKVLAISDVVIFKTRFVASIITLILTPIKGALLIDYVYIQFSNNCANPANIAVI